ncbi:hypothetical protein BJ165DRAFT_845811 [Panaeolus papilionaceus]|nr:hypothetical protein BJ165DRAFT_845811 [Panaeolus papilionaceus]
MYLHSLGFFLLSLPLTVTSVDTATPKATCLPDTPYKWTYNSLAQSPCDVVSALGSTCTNGDWVVPAIMQNSDPGWQYTFPGFNNSGANPCPCSSVFYSLIAACILCQNADSLIVPWSQYHASCSLAYTDIFPLPLPRNIAVPRWAYLSVIGDKFSPTNAFDERSTITLDTTANNSLAFGPADPQFNSGPNTYVKVVAGGIVAGFVLVLGGILYVTYRLCWRARKRRNTPEDPLLPREDCIPYPISPPPTPPPSKLRQEDQANIRWNNGQSPSTPGYGHKGYHPRPAERPWLINGMSEMPIIAPTAAYSIPPTYMMLQPPSYESLALDETGS